MAFATPLFGLLAVLSEAANLYGLLGPTGNPGGSSVPLVCATLRSHLILKSAQLSRYDAS